MLPQIYEFPPFFTRQPNNDTWQSQLRHWQEVLVEWCRSNHLHELTDTSEVFTNGRIQRTLPPAVAREVLDYLVSNGWGENIGKAVYVYSRKPPELAAAIRAWAVDTGQSGAVVTLYELAEGESPGLERCAGADETGLRRAAQLIAKKGDAALLHEDGQIVGLKFVNTLL